MYSTEDGKSRQVTDGMSDAQFSYFDKNGKFLYFMASTNLGLSPAWLDMSSDDHSTSGPSGAPTKSPTKPICVCGRHVGWGKHKPDSL